jgi:hypothetical protein
MKKHITLLILCALSFMIQAHTIFTTEPVGSSLTFDDFSVVSNFTVGTNPPYTAYNYLQTSTSFLVMNGSVPVEVSSANFQNWDNDPVEPYAGGFFIPGIYEDWSYDASSTNVWSNVAEYQSGDINFVGGVGNRLDDPSPTLGAPYCEWLPVCQFTNLNQSDLSVKLFRYMRPITTSGGTFYSNQGTHPYDYDFDGIDGTLDDFAASYIPGTPSCFWPAGCPIDRYRLQNYTAPTIYNSLSTGVPDYSLTNQTDFVYSNTSEVCYQYEVVNLKQNQSVLYWLYPKPIKINNSVENHPTDINYFQKNLTAIGVCEFTGTNVSANYTALAFTVNGGGTPASAIKTLAVEIVGGMVESGLDAGIGEIYTGKYWEIFYDTRRSSSTADFTFTYPDEELLTNNADYLRIAYRNDYNQSWTIWNNFTHDTVNRKLTANGFSGGDAHWAIAIAPLPTPSNIIIATATSEVDLDWDDVADATIYKIYRSTNPYSGFVQINTSTVSNYTDSDVFTGNMYFYYITADNAKK